MKRENLRKMILAAIFIAMIILLAFTPMLGYIKIGALSITTIGIPVVIGSIILGPYYGMLLGFVFGMTSFLQCFLGDAFGAALVAISPVRTFIVCIVPRVLVGLVPALLFRLIMKRPTNSRTVAVFVSALAGSLTNTVFFLGFLGLLFGQTDYIKGMQETEAGHISLIALLVGFASVNAILEAVATAIIAPPVYFALQPRKKVVGIDLGASGTKIVLMRGSKLIKTTMKQENETLEEAIVRFNPENAEAITVTGVGAASVPDTILNRKVVKVDEFASLYRGATVVGKRFNMIVVSVGTGTALDRKSVV